MFTSLDLRFSVGRCVRSSFFGQIDINLVRFVIQKSCRKLDSQSIRRSLAIVPQIPFIEIFAFQRFDRAKGNVAEWLQVSERIQICEDWD